MDLVADPDFTLHVADVRDVLPSLPAESVDCALTSPPFYGLRDYGVDRQIGLEATPDEWVAELVGVFREVRRILKPAGTLWVECGDSYAASPPGNVRGVGETSGLHGAATSEKYRETLMSGHATKRDTSRIPGIKSKDLIGSPWMLAFALRADGWYLRQCIIWQKPNPMPESVRDRCTTSHSYLFLLSKQPRYWFDAEAIAEPAEWARWGDQTVPKYEGTETAAGWIQPKTKAELRSGRVGRYQERAMYGIGDGTTPRKTLDEASASKNARSVWTIPTQGYSEAHFATWPEALVERVLKAGCPEWVCVACGKARERLTEASYGKSPAHGAGPTVRKRNENVDVNGWAGETMPRLAKTTKTVGWSDCGCGQGFTPGVCLDPFIGSGTTALVARRLGRKAVGVELNPEYAQMAARRLQQLSLIA
jgi:DNA modification methylase